MDKPLTEEVGESRAMELASSACGQLNQSEHVPLRIS
jgi:hypothetical protein